MNEYEKRNDRAQALARKSEIHRLCCLFEDRWKSDVEPRIEEFLVDASADARRDLLCELVALEVELRRASGRSAGLDEYLARFPDEPQQIRAGFALVSDFDSTKHVAGRSLDSTFWDESSQPAASGAEATESQPALATVQRLRIERPHKKGGLGQVSIAKDLMLNREVAFKEIQPRFADDREGRSRFMQEAAITGGLEHPGIVPVYGVGRGADGRPYYTMRFIRGTNLADALLQFHAAGRPARDSLEFRKLLGRFVDVCNAIAYAHHRGVIHRDIKPSNVMLGDYGETLVVDWGLAKLVNSSHRQDVGIEPPLQLREDASPTLAGRIVGTPAYMSPEQASGLAQASTTACDVYSLGATLYALLTGKPPFDSQGRLPRDVCAEVQVGEFPKPSKVHSSAPLALEAVCLKAMALEPLHRYATATALAEDIDRWLADECPTAYQEPHSERAGRYLRKHRGVATVAALAVAAILSIVVYLRIERNAVKAQTAANTTSDVTIANAKERIERRDWEAADQLIDDALKATPNRAEAYSLRGRINEGIERFDLAAADFDRAVAIAPNDARTYFDRGTFFSRQRRFDEAEQDFAKAVDLNHNYALAYVNWANVARDRGRPEEALARYEQALRIDPNFERAYSGLAVLHQEQGRFGEAFKAYANGLALAPQDAELLTNRANLYTDQGQLDEAMRDLDLAIRYDRLFANAYNSRGHVLLLLGKSTEAIADYTLAIKHDPERAMPYSNRGSALQKRGQVEAALDDYNRAIELDPNFAGTYAYRAGPLRQLNRLEEALADCNYSLKLAESAVAYMNRGNVYRSMKKYEEALADYERALQLEPGSADTYLNRGVLHFTTKDLKRAVEDYAKAIEINPRDALAYVNRANALKDLGQRPEALADYDHAIALDPESENAYFNRAVFHFDQRAYVLAVSDLTEAINREPAVAKYFKTRADAYNGLEKDQLALQDFDKAIEIDAMFTDAYINRAALLVNSDMERALADISTALDQAPKNPLVLLNIGAIMDRKGRHAESEQYLTQAIQLDGTQFLPYAHRALARLHQQKYDEALEDFAKSLELEQDAETLMNRAELHFDREDYPLALADYTTALSVAAPQLIPRLYAQRATVHAQRGAFQEAAEDCERALALDPQHAQALIIRASARTNLGDERGAMDDFKVALEIGGEPPMLSMLYHNRGVLLHKLGDKQGALDDFNRALVLDPASVEALNARADAYLERGDIDEALADIDKAIRLRPESANLRNTHGRVLRHLERFDQALREYSEAIRLRPESPAAYGNRGELYQATKNNALALADYNRCLELNCDDGDVLLNRARLHLNDGRFEAALADVDAALAANDQSVDACHAARGDIYIAQGKYAEAVASFTENLARRPEQARGYLCRAEAEMALELDPLTLRDAEMAERLGLHDADELYRLSRLFAQLGGRRSNGDDEKQNAFNRQATDGLSKAIDAGFRDLDRLRNDDAWNALRSDAEFMKLIKRVEDQLAR